MTTDNLAVVEPDEIIVEQSQLDRIESKVDTLLGYLGELDEAVKPIIESFSSGSNPIAAMLSGMFSKRG